MVSSPEPSVDATVSRSDGRGERLGSALRVRGRVRARVDGATGRRAREHPSIWGETMATRANRAGC